ncbi:MAG TPA: hypothetical protein PK534_09290 [Chitinophagales bacterium]|nr:hypothetical protein [Chitinophagales bacterium]
MKKVYWILSFCNFDVAFVECGQRPPDEVDTGRPSEDLRQGSATQSNY